MVYVIPVILLIMLTLHSINGCLDTESREQKKEKEPPYTYVLLFNSTPYSMKINIDTFILRYIIAYLVNDNMMYLINTMFYMCILFVFVYVHCLDLTFHTLLLIF